MTTTLQASEPRCPDCGHPVSDHDMNGCICFDRLAREDCSCRLTGEFLREFLTPDPHTE